MRLKSGAVRIGNYSKLGHYKVVMRFADKSGNWSNYLRMAHFTIDDKDKTRQAFAIGIVSAIILAILGVVLHVFELA